MLHTSGVDVASTEFPDAISACLFTIREAMRRQPLQRKDIARSAIVRLLPFTTIADLDSDIATALLASLKQYIKAVGSASDLSPIIERLEAQKQKHATRLLLQLSLRAYPQDVKLLAAQVTLEEPSQKMLAMNG
jgi:hypothetical protein